ncbi:MAG: sensor histidine kinase [Vicinamibacterales bacterium]
MKRAQIERLSIRTALAIGFCVTLGLWLYTGYVFTQRIETAESEAADVTSRYLRAQELLSTVRAQVLLSSVRVRDALLDPQPEALRQRREQVDAAHRIVTMALTDYEPVIGSTAESAQIERLRHEVGEFHATSTAVLSDAAGKNATQIREVLNRHIVPRREAALSISEEIQAINRRAFVQQQQDISAIHRGAELENRERLGMALVIGLGVVLLTSIYATQLEGRLRVQMERDALMSQELQDSAAKLIAAQEEERRRIARELHDEVGQVLGALKVEIEVAQRSVAAAGGSPGVLGEAQSIADGAIKTVRTITQQLHPATLDDLGLAAAIDSSLRGLARRQDIRAELHQKDWPERLPRDVELAAYRIVQEAITNVSKHANATECHVHLTHLRDRLLIEVEDDGVGFVEDTDRPIIARGLGLISVRERAVRLGGTFNILSTPGEGTRLIVSLPERGALA